MHLLSILLFAASANMDSLVVGLSFGMRRVVIGPLPCFLIGWITLVGTGVALALGEGAAYLIPGFAAEEVGGWLILLIGLWGLLRCWKGRGAPQEEKASGSLALWEVVVLGAALTVNNMALGVGAGITGLSLIPTALNSFLFSMLFLWGGNRIGRSESTERIGQIAEPLANLMMVVLGLWELLV